MRLRPVILTILGVAACVLAGRSNVLAQGPVKPLRIVIMREETWPDVVGLSDCTLGKLYVVDTFPSGGAPVVFPGMPLGSTLELPWRNNLNEISRIPAGTYKGKVQADGSLGWRIAVDPVPKRTLVRIRGCPRTC